MHIPQTQTPPRPLGEIVELATREALRGYIGRVGWRSAIIDLGLSERALRSVLTCRPVRIATARALRLGLAMSAQQGRQP